MASEISKSRFLNTKEGFSGIKAVSFLPYLKTISLAADDTFQGTGLTGSVYRYEVKNDGCNYDEEGKPDRNTGTTVYTGTLNLVLPILDRATRDEVKLLAYGRPQVFIEKFDGTILLAGSEFGCELDSIKIGTGGKRSDMSGFTLQFKTEERRPIVYVVGTGSTAYNAAINITGAIQPSV